MRARCVVVVCALLPWGGRGRREVEPRRREAISHFFRCEKRDVRGRPTHSPIHTHTPHSVYPCVRIQAPVLLCSAQCRIPDRACRSADGVRYNPVRERASVCARRCASTGSFFGGQCFSVRGCASGWFWRVYLVQNKGSGRSPCNTTGQITRDATPRASCPKKTPHGTEDYGIPRSTLCRDVPRTRPLNATCGRRFPHSTTRHAGRRTRVPDGTVRIRRL